MAPFNACVALMNSDVKYMDALYEKLEAQHAVQWIAYSCDESMTDVEWWVMTITQVYCKDKAFDAYCSVHNNWSLSVRWILAKFTNNKNRRKPLHFCEEEENATACVGFFYLWICLTFISLTMMKIGTVCIESFVFTIVNNVEFLLTFYPHISSHLFARYTWLWLCCYVIRIV